MASDLATLESLLQQGNSQKKILSFFKGMPESERQTFSKHCAAWYKKQLKHQRDNLFNESGNSISINSHKLLPVAVLAAYCCCSFSVFKSGGWLTRIDSELIYQALSDRRPKWASQWLAHSLRQSWPGEWAAFRRLIHEGVCEKPVDDDYIRLMIDGVSHETKNVASRLRSDPELLEQDFWRIFQVVCVMRNGSFFGNHDDAWLTGILQLEKQKELDRDKLFEAILSTPHIGFNQSHIKFFLELHDRLKPSTAELAQRLPDYAAMVDSPLAPVSKWSFEIVQKIDKGQKLSAESLADVLESGLRSPIKSRVKSSLKWMQELIKRDPSCTAQVCRIATGGLQHEKADVQAEAWKFLEKHATGDAELIESIKEAQSHVAASTKKAIGAWLKNNATHTAASVQAETDSGQAPQSNIDELISEAKSKPKKWRELCGMDALLKARTVKPFHIPPTQFSGMEFQRLEHAQPLVPIETLDELFETATMVLESSDRHDDSERVIDALTRIKVDQEHASYGPLKKRLKQLAKRVGSETFIGAGNHVDLVMLLQVWGSMQTADELHASMSRSSEEKPCGLVGFLSIRNKEIFKRLESGQSIQLLGTMTHSGGWIDPNMLVAKLKSVKDESALIEKDLLLSLLRLAPDNRKEALKALNRLKNKTSEYAQALRYALGGDVKIGKSAPIWVAAARSQNPFEDDPQVEKRFPGLGPDTGRVARYNFRDEGDETIVFADDSPKTTTYSFEYPKDPVFDLPTMLVHQFGTERSAIDSLDTKPEPWELSNVAATVWPLNRDGFYAHRYVPSDDMDSLFDVNTPFNAPQSRALVQSLISGYVVYAPEVTAATDLAIAAIEDGRYNAQQVGQYMAEELGSVQRLAKALTPIAEVSKLHAFQIVNSILAIFDYPLPEKIPNRISDLFALLNECLLELEMPLPAEKVDALAPWNKGSSKTAKAVRSIIEFQPSAPFNFDAVLAEAIAGRLATERTLL